MEAHERGERAMITPKTSIALPRELIQASAGSGKTHHISSRIIGLLAMGAPVEEVLASTFTRKAAGEISRRILTRLAEGSVNSEKAQELSEYTDNPHLKEPEECRKLLAKILANLHLFNVETLDAFFVRLARSFFQEIGMEPGWTIADETIQEGLRTETLQIVLAETNNAEMNELVRKLNRGDANRDIHDDLLDYVDDLIRIRRQLDSEAVNPWKPDFRVGNPISQEKLKKKALRISDRLRKLEVPKTKDGHPMKGWEKSRNDASDYIEKLDWGSTFEKGIGAKVIEGEVSFSRKEIPSKFVDIFLEARKLARIDLAPRFCRQVEAMGRLAELLETAFEEVQRLLGTYRFEDITYMLGGPDPTGKRDDLHYRLDQKMRHLLIDEFQDTSLEQWKALEPLADELLSGHLDERAGVIVADTKQSIYGWRGAHPELVGKVKDRYRLPESTMPESWRSGSALLDFIADVFQDLPVNPVISKIPVGTRVAETWKKTFTKLKPGENKQGHVCIHLGPGGDTKKGVIQPNLLKYAAGIVKDLHEQMPEREIAVLVRRNSVVGYLLNELQSLGVPASGQGGTPLTDTPPVNAIISALQLADHPSDSVALYHVTHTPLAKIIGLQNNKDEKSIKDLTYSIRAQLLNDGYGPTLDKWVKDLKQVCDTRQTNRLKQLIGMGYRWDERPTLRPKDFIRYVKLESVEDPSSTQVKVMTVHQSKGLEFDVVLLSELYESLTPKIQRTAIPERNQEGSIVQVYPHVKKNFRTLFPEIQEHARELEAKELRDEIGVLYVALTRARHALHIILPPSEDDKRNNSARLIREALSLADEEVGYKGVLLKRGNPNWFKETETDTDGKPVKKRSSPEILIQPHTAGPGRNMTRRSPSSLVNEMYTDLSFILRLDSTINLQYGELVHAWCEKIEWIDDGIPDNKTLKAIARDKTPGISDEKITALISEFRTWMDMDPIRNILSRNTFPSDPDTFIKIENELPFVRRIGDEIQEGFIDRVVLTHRNGQVLRAEVLDFKTDNIDTTNQDIFFDYTERYRPQITAYCKVIKEQYGLAEGNVSGKLVFLRSGTVIDVV